MAEGLNTGILKQNSNQGSGRDSDQGGQGVRVELGLEEQRAGEGLRPWIQWFRVGIGPGAQGVRAAFRPVVWGQGQDSDHGVRGTVRDLDPTLRVASPMYRLLDSLHAIPLFGGYRDKSRERRREREAGKGKSCPSLVRSRVTRVWNGELARKLPPIKTNLLCKPFVQLLTAIQDQALSLWSSLELCH